MNDKAVKLLWQMVISTMVKKMVKKMERTWELYEQYMLETRLHVQVSE